jgi:hypothetical protein
MVVLQEVVMLLLWTLLGDLHFYMFLAVVLE